MCALQDLRTLLITDKTGEVDWGQIITSHECQRKGFRPDFAGLGAQSKVISAGESMIRASSSINSILF